LDILVVKVIQWDMQVVEVIQVVVGRLGDIQVVKDIKDI
jgi:hypothetical protein